MKTFAVSLAMLAAVAMAAGTPQDDARRSASSDEVFRAGESLVAEKSWALAHAEFERVAKSDLDAGARRWVSFRLADTAWRSFASSASSDPSILDASRRALTEILAATPRTGDRDHVFAEASESLADSYWLVEQNRNWNQAWPHYEHALAWWGASSSIAVARDRYLGIVWNAARPPEVEPHFVYGHYGNTLPVEVLENVLRIATNPADRAHAQYLLAMTRRHRGGWEQQRFVVPAFQAAIGEGRGTPWFDDALFHFAQWMEQTGHARRQAGGGFSWEQDYVAAVALYRRVVDEIGKGQTRYYDDAVSRIAEITGASVGVQVTNVYAPKTEVSFHVTSRNAPRVELALYEIDLVHDPGFDDQHSDPDRWIHEMDLGARRSVRSWTHATADRGAHRMHQEAVRLEKPLAPGAYLLEARSGAASARDLVLVTRATLVTKASAKQLLAFAADAESGAPIAGAKIRVLQRTYRKNRGAWRALEATTGADGIVSLEFLESDRNDHFFVGMDSALGQAFTTSYRSSRGSLEETWKIYAFTDRPAYRPEDTVGWKIVARTHDGEGYATPRGRQVAYEVIDPRGSKLAESSVELGAFGSAWAELPLGKDLPLGEYRIHLYATEQNKRQRSIGQATLFRLEEYKLPEFRVEVATPRDEAGRVRTARTGDVLEVDVKAHYYYGAPVAGAEVEVVVYRKPYYHSWAPPHRFPWLYEQSHSGGYGRQHLGQVVHRQQLATDADGQARISYPTPIGNGQNLEFTIEARVIDASRREVSSRGSVRVTQQSFFVHAVPQRNVLHPGDRATVDVHALDANRNPIVTRGTVTITRDRWREVWVDPSGKSYEGRALDDLRARFAAEGRVFPPPAIGRGPRWHRRAHGYEHQQISVQSVNTDAKGRAEVSFTPEAEGMYRVHWASEETDGGSIETSAIVWAGTNESTDLGFRSGAVQIIADRDTFAAGSTAPIMVTTPTAGRWVLFVVESDDVLAHRVLALDGTVKFLELPVTDGWTPNVVLTASMVADGNLATDRRDIVVPPLKHFLEVELELDQTRYEPGAEGTATVRTLDDAGNPVSAEVSLAVVDESVYAIQSDLAGDPRQFFFGERRQHAVVTTSTFQMKSYARKPVVTVTGGPQTEGEAAERDLVGAREAFADGKSDVGGSQRNEFRQNGAFAVAKRSAAGGSLASFGAMPSSEMPAMSTMSLDEDMMPGQEPALGADTPGGVVVRTDFRATALWEPAIVTDRSGRATVPVQFPETLTGWRALARAASNSSQFGTATTTATTSKPLLVRLQAPRFLVVGDRTTVSGVMHNDTESALEVQPKLEVEGATITGLLVGGRLVKAEASVVLIPPGSEARVDWAVVSADAGQTRLQVSARTTRARTPMSDAMERTIPVAEHGIEKLVARSGKARESVTSVTLDLPAARRPGSTTFEVSIAPSLATTMLDALPYLIDYPYGCTEQTMSRFLPAVIVARTMRQLGLDAETAMTRAFGGIEEPSAGTTHRKGKRSLEQLDEMVDRGLERLYDFQHGDGGWGWWQQGESDHFMSSYVVWGLALALEAGVEVDRNALYRAGKFLAAELVEREDDVDLQAWMLHAVAHAHRAVGRTTLGSWDRAAIENLWEKRSRLNAYGRAVFLLALEVYGDFDHRVAALTRNLSNGVVRDASPDTSVIAQGGQGAAATAVGTAHWGADGIGWHWSSDSVESTAFGLMALLATDPQHELVEEVTQWLVRNRRGAQWSNTRDTAISILALSSYLESSGEVANDVSFEILVNGRQLATESLDRADALGAPLRFSVPSDWLRSGENVVAIKRLGGQGALYFNVEARFFSLEEPIAPAGNEVFVRRDYVRLARRTTLLGGYALDRLPLEDHGEVTSGERVEVTLTIEAKNDLEYLLIEDLKPAGLEATVLQSGADWMAQELRADKTARRFAPPTEESTPRSAENDGTTGRRRWVYQELRDRKIALFIDKLPQGVWEIRYELRAEVPGRYHALPVMTHAMYAPEIRANGAETRISVADPPEPN